MASIEQLSTALRNADAAGDTAAARVLAGEITKMQGAPAAPPPDKYQQAAIDDRAKAEAAGVPSQDAGLARLAIQGATFNTADEILAGLMTPLEMIRRKTLDPREGYAYAKAQEDLGLAKGREKAGWAGTAADIGGGLLTGSGLARGGVTLARTLAPNAGLPARMVASAGDAAVMGGVAGAGEGNTAAERLGNAGTGAAIGAGVGGATPAVLKVAGALLSPITSNIRARVNPTGYAQSQVARAMMESSRTPRQIADEVAQAAREGQGSYAVADAMGNPGQRMLSTVTRAPGQGRTDAVEFLDQRQAGQGRRVANALAEGFDSPQTAAQTEARLTQARDTASDTAYGAARQGAGPVDLSRSVANIDATLQPGVNQIATPASGIANDSIESALQGFRGRLTDGRSVLTDYTAVERVRGDLADAVNAAVRAGNGNRARLLGGVLREVDAAMEGASPGFRAANAQHAQSSRVIEAVDTGRQASMRGRTEDTIPAFQALSPEGQAAHRAGYVDPLIADAQKGAFGANKARPLTGDAFRDEAAVMAPRNDLLQRRLARENTMFETRNHASGNSRTADNLADQGAMGVDPTLVGNILTGNWGGAARSALSAGQNALTGNTPAVRQEVARILTMRGGNVSAAQMQDILTQAINRVRAIQNISSVLGRGASGGLAVAPATQR